jgi:hypothetical protein
MALRLPVTEPRGAHDRATCELVLEALLRRCGPIVDRPGLADACGDDTRLINYARDTLGLFAQLGQVDHVRRDLWVIDEHARLADDAALHEEFLVAAVATRALGPWATIAGAWALVLGGVLRPRDVLPGIRFALTPRRARLSTQCSSGRGRRDEFVGALGPAIERRHMSFVRGRAITAVTRPVERIGQGGWLELDGFGAHVLDPIDALVSMLEHPRIGGGVDAARAAALPVAARVGIEAIVDGGARHPSVAVRRRLAFVLVGTVERTQHTTAWLGEDEFGFVDDIGQLWRIQRGLDLQLAGRPTLLDPHRLPVGRRDRFVNVVDNRDAPVALPTTGPNGVPLREQARRALEQARRRADALEAAEWDAMDRRAAERLRRQMLGGGG